MFIKMDKLALRPCDIKQPHLILKISPSSVIHHVKVDGNIISTALSDNSRDVNIIRIDY